MDIINRNVIKKLNSKDKKEQDTEILKSFDRKN